MALYTFIMDYKGGTYISQIRSSFRNAPIKWARNLDVSGVFGFGKNAKDVLIEAMGLEEPVALDDVKNGWCVSALIRDELALIHFIETADNAPKATDN